MRQSRRRRWTEDENRVVLEMSDHDDNLAIKLNRSKFAIQKQRERLRDQQHKGERLESWEIKLMEAEKLKGHNTVN